MRPWSMLIILTALMLFTVMACLPPATLPVATTVVPPTPTGPASVVSTVAPTVGPTATETTAPAVILVPTETIPLTMTPVPTATPAPTNTPLPPATDADFTFTVLTTGLDQPWEITHGPDGYLWLTERLGKRVLHVDPTDGTWTVLTTVEEALAESSQQGLLGLALHPELLHGSGNDFVYVLFTHHAHAANPLDRFVTVRRYRYDQAIGQLVEPTDLLANLPASSDHIGGRLTFGADGKLYFPLGDRGANNLSNYCRPNLAQLLPTAAEIAAGDYRHYVGKILRVNPDGSIPNDNPTWDGVQSHIYSVGHRNVQGLVAANGQIYATEHGPKTDDEVNRIIGGYNYGWPLIAGFQDDRGYVYASWSDATVPCETLEFSDYLLPDAVLRQPESEATVANFVSPLYAFGTVDNSYDFRRADCAPNFYICWPTVAPTGIDYYPLLAEGVPGWGNSLLVAALKTGSLYRLPLAADGSRVAGAPQPVLVTTNRYRDLAIAPDGRTIYIITDSQGTTQDVAGLPTNVLQAPGAILVWEYKAAQISQ